MPSFAHSISTWSNRPAAASPSPARNRAIVTWSGTSPAQITRNAMSVRHAASIRREDVTRFAYAQTSSAVSMSGS